MHTTNLCLWVGIGLSLGLGCSPTTEPKWKLSTYQATGELRCAALTHNGEIIAVGSKEGVIELWDIESGKRLRKWIAHTGSVYSLAFDSVDKRLVSEGRDGEMVIWDSDTGVGLLRISDPSGAPTVPEHKFNNSRVCFLDNDTRVAGFALFWNASTGEKLSWHGSRGPVACSGELLASEARSGFHVINVNDASELLWKRGAGVQCLALSPDGKRLAIGRALFAAGCEVVDLDKPQKLSRVPGVKAWVLGVAYSEDSRQLATSEHKLGIKIFDADLRSLTDSIASDGNDNSWISFAGADSRIIGIGGNDEIRIWTRSPMSPGE